MVSIEAYGARLRAIAEELPLDDAKRAEASLRDAHAMLTVALKEGRRMESMLELSRACEHLDAMTRRLNAAASSIDAYLAAIGVGGASTTKTSPPGTAPAAPLPSDGGPDWWRRRVCELTDDDTGIDAEPSRLGVTDLFSRLVDAARRDDRDGYRRLLLTAPPEIAVRLPGLALPMIRSLAADRHGQFPTTEDVAKLRSRLDGRARRLLPKLPDDVTVGQVNAACGLASRRPVRSGDAEAVDAAAIGPILVATMHSISPRPTGRSA